VGSTEQTKTGNLIIEGVLRLGQFTTANAPSGTEGALYYDTTESTTKIYSNSTWGDLGGGTEPGQLPTYTTAERDALSPSTGLMIYNTDYDQVQTYTQTAWSGITGNKDLGIECASAMDCASGFCVDSVCCDTSLDNCSGNCRRCNVAGSMGVCIDVDSDCTGNCDVCSSGNCVASASLCTGDCDVCSGSGTAYSCEASNALCSNTTSSCACSGSGTAFNCSTCPDTYGVCGHPTCSSYVCGNETTSYDGTQCATCKQCSSGSCVSVAVGTSGYGCTATHYRCDGGGNCTAPCSTSVVCESQAATNYSCTTLCANREYCTCKCAHQGGYDTNCPGTEQSCANYSCNCSCYTWLY